MFSPLPARDLQDPCGDPQRGVTCFVEPSERERRTKLLLRRQTFPGSESLKAPRLFYALSIANLQLRMSSKDMELNNVASGSERHAQPRACKNCVRAKAKCSNDLETVGKCQRYRSRPLLYKPSADTCFVDAIG